MFLTYRHIVRYREQKCFRYFFAKIKKSFEKVVDICVVMVYNVVTEQEKSSKIKKDEVLKMRKAMERKFYLTNEARENAINDIGKQIDAILSTTNAELDYVTARRIVDNLSMLRDAIKGEMECAHTNSRCCGSEAR